jgi:hypothetical protein
MVKRTPSNQAADLQPQNRRGNRRGKRQLHPAMIPYQFKPGHSGNPGGRPRRKPLTDMLIRFLEQIDPKDKQKRQFAQKLIREWYDRAMKKSDLLLIEILSRIEGKLAPETDQERKSERAYKVVVLDVPRPPRPVPPDMPVVKILPALKNQSDESVADHLSG